MKKVIAFVALLTFLTGGISMAKTQQQRIQDVFEKLSADNMKILDDFYAKDVFFEDPLGKHQGIDSVKKYYQRLYQNVTSIKFTFTDLVSDGPEHVLFWTMDLKTDSLNSGELITVEGNSIIKFNEQDLVSYHRDYFDMGAFVYEHVPVLGWAIGKVKKRMKGE